MSTLKVLVADDSRTIRTQLKQILDGAGFEVVMASNGREAVETICRENPFLAVLDVNMPHLDGYGVCQALKQLGDPWESLPIVFLTTLRSRALEMLGSELGAYLQKPVERDVLLETINAFVPEQLC